MSNEGFEKGKKAFERMTPEQRAECGRKGGLAKREATRRRKELKETLNLLLELPVGTGRVTDVKDIKAFAKLSGKNVTVDQAMLIKLVQRALKGDVNAIAMVRDTIGEKPVEKLDVKDVTPVIISGEDDLSD